MEKRVINNGNFNTEFDPQAIMYCGTVDVDIIGDLTDDDDVYVLNVWSGSGYVSDLFAVAANTEEEARAKFLEYCREKGWTSYYRDDEDLRDYVSEDDRPSDEIYDFVREWVNDKIIEQDLRDNFFAYLDADIDDINSIDNLPFVFKPYSIIDMIENVDMEKRYKLTEAFEQIEAYADALRKAEDYFNSDWVYNDWIGGGLCGYIRAENYQEQCFTFDEFIENIKKLQEVA